MISRLFNLMAENFSFTKPDFIMLAIPNPETQSGGIKAVAIATPGIALDLSFCEPEIIPAIPPNKATAASKNVGAVRWLISVVKSPKGVIKKYKVEVNKAIPIDTPKCLNEILSEL